MIECVPCGVSFQYSLSSFVAALGSAMREVCSAVAETPSSEMKRLFRKIGLTAAPEESRARRETAAMRRINAEIGKISDRLKRVSSRAARGYWYEEVDDIPSHHMDIARALSGNSFANTALDEILGIENQLVGLVARTSAAVDSAIRLRKSVPPIGVNHNETRESLPA